MILVHINANFFLPPTLAILRGKTPDRSEVTAPRHFLRPRLLGLPSVPPRPCLRRGKLRVNIPPPGILSIL